jgi:mannitol/fructose-specific phosphotransferase system IIA component (Ntr-type)
VRAVARHFRFVIPEATLPDLYVREGDEAIRVLVGSLVEAGVVPEAEESSIHEALRQREEQASTGVGRGIAIFHTQHAAACRLVATVGYCREGIDFHSFDDEPVHLIFLLLSPPSRASQQHRVLEAVSRYLQQYEWCTGHEWWQ